MLHLSFRDNPKATTVHSTWNSQHYNCYPLSLPKSTHTLSLSQDTLFAFQRRLTDPSRTLSFLIRIIALRHNKTFIASYLLSNTLIKQVQDGTATPIVPIRRYSIVKMQLIFHLVTHLAWAATALGAVLPVKPGFTSHEITKADGSKDVLYLRSDFVLANADDTGVGTGTAGIAGRDRPPPANVPFTATDSPVANCPIGMSSMDIDTNSVPAATLADCQALQAAMDTNNGFWNQTNWHAMYTLATLGTCKFSAFRWDGGDQELKYVFFSFFFGSLLFLCLHFSSHKTPWSFSRCFSLGAPTILSGAHDYHPLSHRHDCILSGSRNL